MAVWIWKLIGEIFQQKWNKVKKNATEKIKVIRKYILNWYKSSIGKLENIVWRYVELERISLKNIKFIYSM